MEVAVLPSLPVIPDRVKLLHGFMVSLAVARKKMQAEIFSLKIKSRLSPLPVDRQSSRCHEPLELIVSHQYNTESKSGLQHYQISSKNAHMETPGYWDVFTGKSDLSPFSNISEYLSGGSSDLFQASETFFFSQTKFFSSL